MIGLEKLKRENESLRHELSLIRGSKGICLLFHSLTGN